MENIEILKKVDSVKEIIDEFKLKESIVINGIIAPKLIEHNPKQDLSEIYILNYDNDYPYIIKCPIVSSERNSYTINYKRREKLSGHEEGECWITFETYYEKKLLKHEINNYPGYKGMTSYPFALANLLLLEKSNILNTLQKMNDLDAYQRYVMASEKGLIFGLEYIAKYLNMHYLFRLEDDTQLNTEYEDEMYGCHTTKKLIKI